MKLLSWNVNGLRAILKKGFEDILAEHDADIVCLQETRLAAEEPEPPAGYSYCYWNNADKKGYSGTAILTRTEPEQVTMDIGKRKHAREGRVITARFRDFDLVTAYVPNAGQGGLARLEYRMEWDRDFRRYLEGLVRERPVIVCGDLNVAHEEIDLARPQANGQSAGFTDEEREGFRKLLAAGFVDSFREFEPGPGHYSWWSYRGGMRRKNIGWRIDYFLVSGNLRSKLTRAFILSDVMGSDHCPVGIELKGKLKRGA